MTSLDLSTALDGTGVDRDSVERAAWLLTGVVEADAPETLVDVGRRVAEWVAGQPDPEVALGQALRRAGRELKVRDGRPRLILVEPATAAAAVPSGPPPAPATAERAGRELARRGLASIGRPSAVRPVLDPAGITARRMRVARGALWVRNLGAIVLLLLAYQWWGTGFEQRRAQAQLASAFGHTMRPPGADSPAVSGPPQRGSASSAMAPTGPVVLPGQAVARLEIPAIHVDQFVVQGTSEADLKRGPGHYDGTPMPGQPGNAAIAGHRTTYGAPFNRLDELRPGDTVFTTTSAGRFLYVVAQKLTVSPTQTSVVADYGDNRLTLTTCTPKFLATHRLVVVAMLQGPAPAVAVTRTVPPPASTAWPARPDPLVAEQLRRAASWSLDVSAFVLAALLSALLVGLGLAYRPLRRRLPPLAVVAVLTPLWAGGLLLTLEQFNRFLPPNV